MTAQEWASAQAQRMWANSVQDGAEARNMGLDLTANPFENLVQWFEGETKYLLALQYLASAWQAGWLCMNAADDLL